MCKGIKLVEAEKGLLHAFWHGKTRSSCNTKDVLKCCRGTRDIETHINHYILMKQTKYYEIFRTTNAELTFGQ